MSVRVLQTFNMEVRAGLVDKETFEERLVGGEGLSLPFLVAV